MEPADRCHACDAVLAERTRYCPYCGVRLDSGVAETTWPGEDVGTSLYVQERPRLFGVPPQDTTLVLGLASAVAGGVLLTIGPVIAGALVLSVAALMLFAFAETYRRRPASAIVLAGYGVLRAELGFARAASSTWMRSRVGRRRLRRRAARLRRARREHVLLLGESVYRDDVAGSEAALASLRELDEHVAATTDAITRLERRAARRLRAARSWRARKTEQALRRAGAGHPRHA